MALTGREALEVMFERRRQAEQRQGEVAGSLCADENTACELQVRGGKGSQPAPQHQ